MKTLCSIKNCFSYISNQIKATFHQLRDASPKEGCLKYLPSGTPEFARVQVLFLLTVENGPQLGYKERQRLPDIGLVVSGELSSWVSSFEVIIFLARNFWDIRFHLCLIQDIPLKQVLVYVLSFNYILYPNTCKQ